MKKLKFLLILPLISLIFLSGCEDDNVIRVATISEITMAGSSDYGVKVRYQDDKRVEDKYYDIQIMTDVDDVGLTIWKERNEKFTIRISERNRWNSLTTIKARAAGLEGKENFEKLKDAVDESYMFNVDKRVKIFLRVVAGESVDNSQKTGKILANTEQVSKLFTLKCEPD